MEEEREGDEERESSGYSSSESVPVVSHDEVSVEYLPEPPMAPADRSIHQRRPLRPIPEGEADPPPSRDFEP